jgi:lysophospholipase L1-like esterase
MDFETFRALGRRGALAALILAGLCCARPPARPSIILCAGDSLTELGYPVYLQKIVKRQGVRAQVLNYGRSGNTSGEYLHFLASQEKKVAAVRPDFVLLELGTNDVRCDGDQTATPVFERNMRALIACFRGFRTRENKPPTILLATVPPVPEETPFPFSQESSRRVRDEINPTLRRMADELRIPLVDNFSLFAAGAPDLLPNVHPSREGYKAMAHAWFAALEPYLKPRPGSKLLP